MCIRDRRRIFYINPQKQSVELGFCRGDLLGENALLKSKGRKQVKTISFRNISEIEDEQILPIIHEAILVDEIKSKKVQK
jgi:hypothetical protein